MCDSAPELAACSRLTRDESHCTVLHSLLYWLLSLQVYTAHHESSYGQSSDLHSHVNEHGIRTDSLPVSRVHNRSGCTL